MIKKSFFVIFILCFGLIPLVNADSTQWYDTKYLYRSVYEIDSSLVDGELEDFPVLVYLNSSYIEWERVNDNLSDLCFVNLDNVLLSHEIDTYTVNVEAWLWVKIPSVSSVLNTKFFMYYGAVTAESIENTENVWSNGYVMVQHMSDNSTSTILDSTENSNDGTKKGANEPLEVSGNIGNAQNGDGSDDYVLIEDHASLQTATFTIMAMIKPDTGYGAVFPRLVIRVAANGGYRFAIDAGAGKLNLLVVDNAGATSEVVSGEVITENAYNFVAGTYDGTNEIVYVNGVEKSEVATKTYNPPSANMYVFGQTPRCFDGIIDELQISTARSSAWVGASYYSQTLQLINLTEIETFNDINVGVALIALIVSFSAFLMVIVFTTKKRR